MEKKKYAMFPNLVILCQYIPTKFFLGRRRRMKGGHVCLRWMRGVTESLQSKNRDIEHTSTSKYSPEAESSISDFLNQGGQHVAWTASVQHLEDQ